MHRGWPGDEAAMKVVLKQDVDSLGLRGDMVEVARGYARNYLLPRGLALEPTPANLKLLDLERKAWEAEAAKRAEDAREVAGRLAALKLRIAKKAGEHDTLYGSVTPAELAQLLAAQGIELDRRKIQLREPIKHLGLFTVPVKLHRDVVGEFQVEVVAELRGPGG
jgi:large subunit ribosomal protein L9